MENENEEVTKDKIEDEEESYKYYKKVKKEGGITEEINLNFNRKIQVKKKRKKI